MALGLFLWVACNFLLFDGSAGLPSMKGYGYPYVADLPNLGDDGEEEVFSSTFDQRDWQASNNQLTGPVYTGYNKPSVEQQPDSVPSWPEPVSSVYGVADFNTASNAAGRDSTERPHLIYEEVFKYPSENTQPSQRYSGVSNTAAGYGQAKDMSKGSSTGYASTLEESPFPSYPTNVGAHPVYPSGMESPSFSFPGGVNRPRDEFSWRPQKTYISTQKVDVSQRVSEPIIPPPPPPSYIVQSRNGYRQARNRLAESSYSPEFPLPMSVSSKGVKGLAPSQPAAPKGVRNPQRTKW